MAIYLMKRKVGIKIAFDIINPLSRVDRNIPVSFRGKNYTFMRKLVYPPP